MENEVKEQLKRKKTIWWMALSVFVLLVFIFCLSKWVCKFLALPKRIPLNSMWFNGMEVDSWIAVAQIILVSLFMLWLLYRNHKK